MPSLTHAIQACNIYLASTRHVFRLHGTVAPLMKSVYPGKWPSPWVSQQSSSRINVHFLHLAETGIKRTAFVGLIIGYCFLVCLVEIPALPRARQRERGGTLRLLLTSLVCYIRLSSDLRHTYAYGTRGTTLQVRVSQSCQPNEEKQRQKMGPAVCLLTLPPSLVPCLPLPGM